MVLPEATESIVALIDILGFSQAVISMKNDPVMRNRVEAAIRVLELAACLPNTDFHRKHIDPQGNIRATLFSDTIIVSTKNPDDYLLILMKAHQIAEFLMRAGFLCRGGVSRGDLVHEGHIFYGEAVVNAHHMESNVAVYPRILVSNEIAQRAISSHKSCAFLLKQDLDEHWYVNLFKGPGILATMDGTPLKSATTIERYWVNAHRCISNGLVENDKKAEIFAKYVWAAKKYNEGAPVSVPHISLGDPVELKPNAYA